MSRLFKVYPALLAGLLLLAAPFATTHAATYTAQERANLKVVTGFFAAMDKAGAKGDMAQEVPGIAEKFMSTDYVQHDVFDPAKFGDGRDGFVRSRSQAPPAGGAPRPAMPPQKILTLAVQGDMVTRISARGDVTIYNLMRIKDGKIVEHWESSSRPMGPVGNAGAAGAPPAAAGPAGAPGAPQGP